MRKGFINVQNKKSVLIIMRFWNIFWAVVVILFVSSSAIAGILGDWLWFISLGYEDMFVRILTTAWSVGILSFLAFLGFGPPP